MHKYAITAVLACVCFAQQPDWKQIKNKPSFTSSDYDWTRTNGHGASGNLATPGSVSITLSPCPRGVSGANTDYYVRISGGTGTAESALVTGGTCVSEAASGTLIVSTSNAHTGLWTVGSDNGGVKEAEQSLTAGGIITVAPNTTILVGASAGLVLSKDDVILSGSGFSSVIKSRDSANTVGLLHVAGDNTLVERLKFDCNRDNSGNANGASCLAIEADNASVESVEVTNSQFIGLGITTGLKNITVRNSWIHDNGGTGGTGFGIHVWWDGSGAKTSDVKIVHNLLERNYPLSGGYYGGATCLDGYDIRVESNTLIDNFNQGAQLATCGVLDEKRYYFLNNLIKLPDGDRTGFATSGIEFAGSMAEISGNSVFGHAGAVGIIIEPVGAVTAGDVVVANNLIKSAGIGIQLGLPGATGYARGNTVTGNRISDCATAGIQIESIGLYNVIANNIILDAVANPIVNNGAGNVIQGNITTSGPGADGLFAVVSNTSQLRARAYNGAAQTISNNSLTPLAYNTETEDVGGLHSTSTNNSRFTVPSGGDGSYLASGMLTFAANGTGSRRFQIRKNGDTVVTQCDSPAPSAGTLALSCSTVVPLVATDYVECLAYQNSGGNVDVLIYGSYCAMSKLW